MVLLFLKQQLHFSPLQSDMVDTQHALLGPTVVHGRQLGMQLSREDEEAFAHFWAVIGYLLGIQDR